MKEGRELKSEKGEPVRERNGKGEHVSMSGHVRTCQVSGAYVFMHVIVDFMNLRGKNTTNNMEIQCL